MTLFLEQISSIEIPSEKLLLLRDLVHVMGLGSDSSIEPDIASIQHGVINHLLLISPYNHIYSYEMGELFGFPQSLRKRCEFT